MGVPAGAKIPLLIQELDDSGRAALEANQPIIERLARLESISDAPAPKGAVTVAARGGTMCLPLADVIDIAAEKARLEKELEKISKDINAMQGRLSNENFIARAQPEVIEETKQRLEDAKSTYDKLKILINNLA